MTFLHQPRGFGQRFGLCASALLATAALSSAHISYTGRNFNADPNFGVSTVTISNQAVTGSYGWADGTDADYGDSHKLRAFRFTLTYDASVTITVKDTAIGSTSAAGLLPGFSVYSGLAHLSPQKADHDFSAASIASRPAETEGSFRALTGWTVWNDGPEFDPSYPAAGETVFGFKGYAVDGTAANFGGVSGITGDGPADGFVSGTFLLGPGDYTIFVGGADYAAGSIGAATSYGINTTLNVVPVPEPAVPLLSGLSLAGVILRRRRA
ncbi:MAG: PEP-CTERM sorting domain-containing protein [Verrucomicrobiota bacterium]